MDRNDRGRDNRDRSRKWDDSDGGHCHFRQSPTRYYEQYGMRYDSGLPESVAVDELGYQSAGALSDGPTQGYARSSGSVGSQGSAERFFRQRDFIPLMNGETRFPTVPSAWYPASEAAKSDIATVCSGSVADDIDIESEISSSVFPSSSDRPTFSRRTSSGGRVEFAEFQKEHVFSSQGVNDMGPPLSRAFLLQQAPFQQGSFSRPGSVRSCGSTAGASSDVAAQVDTDDCGGSLVESFTDGHSVHSQDEHTVGGTRADYEGSEAKQKGDWNESHPLFCNGTSSSVPTNGRVSPGGTVYKGRGIRRYQGRYMQLPLKRFHQNGVDLGTDGPSDYDTRDHDRWNDGRVAHRPRNGTATTTTTTRRPSPDRGYHGRRRSRSRSPARKGRSPPRENWRRNSTGNKNSPIRHSYRRDRYGRERQSESPSRHRHRRRHNNDTGSNNR